MNHIVDIHTHRAAPYPEAVISVRPEEFNPAAGQLYSVGIHPWDTAADVPEATWEALERAALHPQAVAVGEAGIDLIKGGPLFRQMLVFKRQAEISEKTGKPLMVHCVKAHDIITGLKKELNPRQPWLVHGFRGKPTVAKMLTDAGLLLSFGALFNEETVRSAGEEFILAETDESPEPIDNIIARLSEARGRDLKDTVVRNAARFLGGLALAAAALITTATGMRGQRLEPIKFGDFSQWVTRTINESKIIGGATKTLYEIGPSAHLEGNNPYSNMGGSPWGCSNVYARVSGISKTSNTVTPYDRGGNTCARLEAKMEHVKVLGLINMDVMAAGTIFLGRVFEPITSTKGPFQKIEMGIPYTKRPKALVYDFSIDMPAADERTKSTGFSSKKTLKGRDNAEVYVLLQKRWEDSDGKLHAQRVGTGRERYSRSVPWTVGHRLPIHYGDITGKDFYRPWMGLLNGDKAYYARNSKGKMVPVEEEGWAPADAVPTHVLVMVSSSCGEPFVGTEGLTVYADNLAFEF